MTLGVGVEQFCVFCVFWAFSLLATALFVFGSNLCKSKLATIIFDTVFSAFAFVGLLACNVYFNNGEFRFFPFLAIALGIATTYICFGRALDKLSNMVYNLFTTNKVDNDGETVL